LTFAEKKGSFLTKFGGRKVRLNTSLASEGPVRRLSQEYRKSFALTRDIGVGARASSALIARWRGVTLAESLVGTTKINPDTELLFT